MKVMLGDVAIFEGTLEECKAYIIKHYTLQDTIDIDIAYDNGRLASYVLEWK